MFSASWSKSANILGSLAFSSDGGKAEELDVRLIIRQCKCCNASLAPFSRLETGAIKKDKTVGVYIRLQPQLWS